MNDMGFIRNLVGVCLILLLLMIEYNFKHMDKNIILYRLSMTSIN